MGLVCLGRHRSRAARISSGSDECGEGGVRGRRLEGVWSRVAGTRGSQSVLVRVPSHVLVSYKLSFRHTLYM